MTFRFLDDDELHKVKAVGLDVPNVGSSLVEVAEEDGKIVGTMCLVAVPQIHGTWVSPEKRGSSIGARLMKGMLAKAAELGIKTVLTHGTSEKNEEYLERLGFTRQPWSVWMKEIT